MKANRVDDVCRILGSIMPRRKAFNRILGVLAGTTLVAIPVRAACTSQYGQGKGEGDNEMDAKDKSIAAAQKYCTDHGCSYKDCKEDAHNCMDHKGTTVCLSLASCTCS